MTQETMISSMRLKAIVLDSGAAKEEIWTIGLEKCQKTYSFQKTTVRTKEFSSHSQQ